MKEAPLSSAPPAAPVDPIFPRFFDEQYDPQKKLLGLIAYGLYEEARREWADTFKRREDRYPSVDELKAYEGSWTASRLDGLKNAAVQIWLATQTLSPPRFKPKLFATRFVAVSLGTWGAGSLALFSS
jgi:hypothetical protein